MKTRLLFILSMIFLGAVSASLFPSQPASALLEELRTGYFTGTDGPSSTDQGTVIDKGLLNRAVSSNSVDTPSEREALAKNTLGWWAFDLTDKEQFIECIEDYYNRTTNRCDGGSSRDRIGAAFIIQTMRGVDSKDVNVNYPTDSDIADWKSRIRNPDIDLKIDAFAPENTNSSYMFAKSETGTWYFTRLLTEEGNPDSWTSPPGYSNCTRIRYTFITARIKCTTRNYQQVDDVMFYTAFTDLPALAFVSKSDSGIKYRIKINCANAIGNYSGLPEFEGNWDYSIDGTVSGGTTSPSGAPQERKTVKRGDSFTINSLVRNNGNGNGKQYFQAIRPIDLANTARVATYLRLTSNNASGTSYFWRDSDNPGLAPTNTRNRGGLYEVGLNPRDGTVFCFYARVNPAEGDSTTLVATVGARDDSDICVTVKGGPFWNYVPTINPLTDKFPGEEFDVTSVIDNTGTQTGPGITYLRIHSWENESWLDNVAGGLGTNPINGNDAQWVNLGTLGTSGTKSETGRWKVNERTPVGTEICFRTSVAPAEGVGTTVLVASEMNPDPPPTPGVCFKVRDNKRFAMTSTVNRPGGNTISPGGVARFGVNVLNDGDVTAEGNTANVYPAAIRGSAVNISCSFVVSGSAADGGLNSSPSCNPNPPGSNPAYTGNLTIDVKDDAEPGDQVCLRVAGNPLNGFSNGSGLRLGSFDSGLVCYTVAVSPYLQVAGGDVWAGANFDTGAIFPPANTCGTGNKDSKIKSVTSQLSGLWKGSLVEYAAYATGKVTGFGSNNSANSYLLTFANADNPTLGEFTDNPRCIANYYGLLAEPNHTYAPADKTTSSNANINAFAANKQSFIDRGGTGVFSTSGEWKNIKDNRTIVINGNLYIANDIKFDTNYGGSATNNLNVPSLIFVVKGDILIDEDVTQVDALLISHQTIWTCASNATTPREAVATNVCDKQLTINGALIANRVNFMRTREGGSLKGGVNEANSEPAEIINFLPEFYLSKPIFLSDLITKDAFDTVLIKDLPPIY